MRRATVWLILLFGCSLPASAQPTPADSLCTYDACALRIEQPFFGRTQIVQGIEGEHFGRLGIFGSDLSRAVASSERALMHARAYERRRAPAFLAALGGSALLSASIILIERDGGSEALETGMLVGGVGLTFLSIHFSTQAQRHLAQAV